MNGINHNVDVETSAILIKEVIVFKIKASPVFAPAHRSREVIRAVQKHTERNRARERENDKVSQELC